MCDQDHGRIPVAVAAPFLGREDQCVDLGGRQVLARAPLRIALPSRWCRRFADNPRVGRFVAGRRVAIPTVPFSVRGMVSPSCLITAESLASTDATVLFQAENGTLLRREQERWCLTKGCVVTCIALLAQAAAFRVPVPAAPSQDRHPVAPGSPLPAGSRGPAPFFGSSGVAGGTGGGGFSRG